MTTIAEEEQHSATNSRISYLSGITFLRHLSYRMRMLINQLAHLVEAHGTAHCHGGAGVDLEPT